MRNLFIYLLQISGKTQRGVGVGVYLRCWYDDSKGKGVFKLRVPAYIFFVFELLSNMQFEAGMIRYFAVDFTTKFLLNL